MSSSAPSAATTALSSPPDPAIPNWCLGFARFTQRYARSLLLASLLVAMGAASWAARLPVYADFAHLLPQSCESVRQLRALEKRANVLGTLMVAVVADTPEHRATAASQLHGDLRALGGDFVAHLNVDRQVGRRYAWENRWLLASTDDLQLARQALGPFLAGAKRHKNVLALDFEAEAPQASQADDATGAQGIEGLRERLEALAKERDDPGTFVSKDGRMQLMVLQTPFSSGNTGRDAALLARLEPMLQRARNAAPGVDVGLAGDVLSSLAEQQSILQGMALSVAATALLVGLGLYLFYRSLFGTLALAYALLVGTLLTFMATWFVVGHLNLATAFLASIVLGNGINFGIMLLARYLEALRHGVAGERAVALAIADSWRGTLAAALAASAAYGSLTITEFRGFRDFGFIAAVGMVFCWSTAYFIVPPLLHLGARRGWLKAGRPTRLGNTFARLMPPASGKSAFAIAAVGIAISSVGLQYLLDDPFEDNFRNMRSDSRALRHEQQWMHRIDEAFGRGISGGFVIATQSPEQTQQIIAKLREVDKDKPSDARLFGRINALGDFVPSDVSEKKALLAAIRHDIDDAERDGLPLPVRQQLRALTPPHQLQAPSLDDVPSEIAWPFTEANGQRGRLILASPGFGFQMWSAADLTRFADAVRGLSLGPNVLIGGSAFVFSDMIRLIEHDGPRATLAATLAACVAVVAMLGFTRHALVTVLAGALGVLAMLCGCSLVHLRINFLDFVALPITIGIGIDYAVNLCARSRIEGPGQARRALRHAGGAIFLASYTTIVGYGSMLLSTNKGIRSFGHAAILGEATCLIAALLVSPVLLDLIWRAPNPPAPSAPPPTP